MSVDMGCSIPLCTFKFVMVVKAILQRLGLTNVNRLEMTGPRFLSPNVIAALIREFAADIVNPVLVLCARLARPFDRFRHFLDPM